MGDNVTDNRRLERLEDRMELLELPYRYARAVDDRDISVLADLFCASGTFRHADGSFEVEGRSSIFEFYKNKLANFGMSIHAPYGQVIQSQGEHDATGWVDAHAEFVENNAFVTVGLRYEDEYKKEEGVWRFASRTLWFWYFTEWENLAETVVQSDRRRVREPYRMADLPDRLSTYLESKTG